MKRTNQQNRALHKWFTLKADQCRAAGVSPRMAFEKTIELEMTPELMKEIWRQVQIALYKKQSTKDLAKSGEIDELVNHLNRFFAHEFNLDEIALPSHEAGYWDSAELSTPPDDEAPTQV
jgi:hypothetical protein